MAMQFRGGLALAALVLAAGCSDPTLPPPEPPATEAVRLETGTGTLHGTLQLPRGPQPVPVVLLIAGSGPTDRNGNTPLVPGRNDSLKLLAEGLAAEGVASLRYDKRGVARSAAAAPDEHALRFEAYVEDAAAWIHHLARDPRFSTVTVAGHSEGSLVGMLAARDAPADGFASVAGFARRASEVLRDQLRPQLPPERWSESERILAELEAGRTTSSVPAELLPLYRPSVQPYLVSLFRYVPAEEIARLRIPVLVAQGTTDLQVGVAEAEALARAAPGAELLIVVGMNHVLKRVPLDPAAQEASYTDPSLPLAAPLVERVATFARAVTAGR